MGKAEDFYLSWESQVSNLAPSRWQGLIVTFPGPVPCAQASETRKPSPARMSCLVPQSPMPCAP